MSASSNNANAATSLDVLNSPASAARSINESATKPVDCCTRLRCKSMYYRDDERPGRLHVSDAMTYWCSQTMDPQGPDGEHTSPLRCQPNRSCFAGDGGIT
jgi:hypothetical protein